jgi:hypothetical protein
MRAKRIEILEECAPLIADAVNEFSNRWGPYSTKSRTRSLFSLYDKLIEPAWRGYLDSLPTSHQGRIAFANLSLSLIARANGFDELRKAISRTAKYNDPIYSDPIFVATIDTIRYLAISCWSKRPKKLNEDLKDGRNDRKPDEFCRFCGENTELFARYRDEHKPGYKPDIEGAIQLSAKYCKDHRPKIVINNEGKLVEIRNSKYVSASRNLVAFNTEISRLTWQRASLSEPHAKSGDPDVDQFYLQLISQNETYLNDESVLRNEARRLVDNRIDDTKKRIIMLHKNGLTLIEIANLVGMKSRQAVGKALASKIPVEYRFDCAVTPKISTQITTELIRQIKIELGDAVMSALNDPNIFGIMLNDDGILFKEMARKKRLSIGNMPSDQADRVIRLVARSLKIELSEKNREVEGSLPFNKAQFSGYLPPLFDNPIFFIELRRL